MESVSENVTSRRAYAPPSALRPPSLSRSVKDPEPDINGFFCLKLTKKFELEGSSGCGRAARPVAASPLGLDLALVSCGSGVPLPLG